MRHQLQAMRCVPICGLLSLLHIQSVGPSSVSLLPCGLRGFLQTSSWSPWRSKWNHMGEPDSGAWPEKKLTWAVRQTALGLQDGWAPLQILTLQHMHSNSDPHTQYHHACLHTCTLKCTVCLLTGDAPTDTFLLLAVIYTLHPSYKLSGVSAAAVPSGVADR